MDKKHKAMNWTALITAVLAASGGVTNAYFEKELDDSIMDGVAAEVAVFRQFQADTAKALEHQREQIMVLREAVVRIQTTLDLLNERALIRGRNEGYGRRLDESTKEVKKALERLPEEPAPVPEPVPMKRAPAQEQIQQMKREIFK